MFQSMFKSPESERKKILKPCAQGGMGVGGLMSKMVDDVVHNNHVCC